MLSLTGLTACLYTIYMLTCLKAISGTGFGWMGFGWKSLNTPLLWTPLCGVSKVCMYELCFKIKDDLCKRAGFYFRVVPWQSHHGGEVRLKIEKWKCFCTPPYSTSVLLLKMMMRMDDTQCKWFWGSPSPPTSPPTGAEVLTTTTASGETRVKCSFWGSPPP